MREPQNMTSNTVLHSNRRAGMAGLVNIVWTIRLMPWAAGTSASIYIVILLQEETCSPYKRPPRRPSVLAARRSASTSSTRDCVLSAAGSALHASRACSASTAACSQGPQVHLAEANKHGCTGCMYTATWWESQMAVPSHAHIWVK